MSLVQHVIETVQTVNATPYFSEKMMQNDAMPSGSIILKHDLEG